MMDRLTEMISSSDAVDKICGFVGMVVFSVLALVMGTASLMFWLYCFLWAVINIPILFFGFTILAMAYRFLVFRR